MERTQFWPFGPHFSWFSVASTAAFLHQNKPKSTVFFGCRPKKCHQRFFWDFTSSDTKEAKSLQPNCSATVTVPPNLFWICLWCYNNTHTSVRIFSSKDSPPPRSEAWNSSFFCFTLVVLFFLCFLDWSRTTAEFCSKGTYLKQKTIKR